MHVLGDLVRSAAGEQLMLVRGADRYDLFDGDGERLLGGVDDIRSPGARAEVAGCGWEVAVERERGAWQVVAREHNGSAAVACYYPGALPGGRVWVGPDIWLKLRKTHLRYDASWGLRISGEEILRIWPGLHDPSQAIDIVIGPSSSDAPQLPSLLVLFICWVTMIEDSIRIPISLDGAYG